MLIHAFTICAAIANCVVEDKKHEKDEKLIERGFMAMQDALKAIEKHHPKWLNL